MIRVEFENAVLALCQHPSFDHADLSPAQVAKILSNLLELSTHDTPILDGSQRQALIAAAQAKYGTEVVAPILQQIIPRLRLRNFALRCDVLTDCHIQPVCHQEQPLF
jgi:CCR4-NOT transcription complex subunit 1